MRRRGRLKICGKSEDMTAFSVLFQSFVSVKKSTIHIDHELLKKINPYKTKNPLTKSGFFKLNKW
jgi:hypothetical protein